MDVISSLFKYLEAQEPRLEHHDRVTLAIVYPIVTVVYLSLVLHYGPEFMKNRKPFNVKTATRMFNATQVVCNVVFLYYFIPFFFTMTNSYLCPNGLEHTYLQKDVLHFYKNIVSRYLFLRVTDYIDTVFFILSKKTGHVSFLHVYHHIVVVMTFTLCVLMGFVHILYFIGLLNSCVHVIMYGYYFLSTFDSMKPYLWWKKYLTKLQLTQFLMIAVHTLAGFGVCNLPRQVYYYILIQTLVFIGLFSRFYVYRYLNKKSKE